MPGPAPVILPVLSHRILITILWSKYDYDIHFTDGETNSERLHDLLKTTGLARGGFWTPGPMSYLTMLSRLLQQLRENDLITQRSTPPWPSASLCIPNLGAELSPFSDFLNRIHLHKAGVSNSRLRWRFSWGVRRGSLLCTHHGKYFRYFYSLFH